MTASMSTRPPAVAPAPLAGRQLGVAALAIVSLAAGFLHAAVIDGHRGHGIAALLFTVTAIFQVAWAAAVLARPSRLLLLIGAAANIAFVGAWLLSRTTGIAFIDGFQEVESVGVTDAVIAGLEVLLVVGAGLFALAPATRRVWPSGTMGAVSLAGAGLIVALVGVPAAGESNEHGGHGGTEEAAGHDGHAGAGDEGGHADHAGGAGHDDHADAGPVTAEQEAAAAELLATTKDGLWQWVDEKKRYEAGFRTIGDGGTGTEHELNWRWINDDTVLDPDKPESLVFRVTPDGKKVLEAAMFMAPAGTPDDEVPDVGGALTQWHIHDNLCYTPESIVDGFPQRKVAGLTDEQGGCRRGEALTPHAPMLHVWVVPQKCGPFSSLEGVGAGQAIEEVQDPETDPACQHSEH